MKTIFVLLFAVAVAGGGVALYAKYRNTDPTTTFRTVPVKEGDLIALVGASGTLEPEEVVDVGSQVTGPIAARGTDLKDPSKLIDYDSEVEVGTLLAKVDDSVYQAQFDQANANLLKAKADLGQFKAHLEQCEGDWRRAVSLQVLKAIADTDYDLAVANYKAAQANLNVGEATITQCEAALAMAKHNLDYCTIKSPVKGVIIDRRVNVGQTVVSAMSATSLFLIAKDLTRMEVWASVNEADIGRIHKDMPVTFTVDAYPNETFRGVVSQIRMNAVMTQSVVTYTVVVKTDNPDRRLYPYLTANLSFQVEKHDNVLKVPNGALRWKPRPQLVAPEYLSALAPAGKEKGGGNRDAAAKSPGETAGKDTVAEAKTPADPKVAATPEAKTPTDPKVAAALKHAGKFTAPKDANAAKDPRDPKAAGDPTKAKSHVEHGQVWVKDGPLAKPVKVRIGVTDGIDTEISGPEVKADMEVIIGEMTPEQAADMSNPFAPKLFNRAGGPPKTRP